jgi:predicted Rossmann fold flavoprotein
VTDKKRVVIIGGGPAGMTAAITAAENGASVTLVEKNEKLGKKLYITGKGRCNLTNTASVEDTLRSVPRGAKFLRSSLAAFDSARIMEWMESLGCPLKAERGGRVFPASDKASDVTRALTRRMNRLGAAVILNAAASEILAEDGRVTGVSVNNGNGTIRADGVILAAGGLSYPATGSTGDGYALARSLGHTVAETAPSLVPLLSNAEWVRGLAGLSLSMVGVNAEWNGKRIMCETGDMLFTHTGVSGPLILTLSSLIPNPREFSKLRLTVDLKPGMTAEMIEKRLIAELSASPNKLLRNLLLSWLPSRLAETFVTLCGFNIDVKASEITKAKRVGLTETLKRLPIPVSSLAGYDEAIITRGGITLGEIDPKTLESKLARGLFFCGEVIDADALTGGYNLTIAISTGAKAGTRAAFQAGVGLVV